MFTFIELPPFSALREELFADDEFSALQGYLADHPEAGDVIPYWRLPQIALGRKRQG